ncbi:Conserved developmentally regulated protein [Plasmopara halstedii]|uniref:Conserved developmentally regulated protein n=1 Tax=Plasmopara halstedii TaxID=4781 RepID=A0A0P1A8R4_PLAHL|nr:Conserved developmentally regulated protein [Plasmopara halstedii]CEG36613.1 Conserved developmentally regulated protein [Plasmopara halstedii]|eukprot:XP_024572982.1 Conserved developmentally regulated protein [Plasmopara halstedii]
MATTLGVLGFNQDMNASTSSPSNQESVNERLTFRLRSHGWIDRENELFLSIPKCATACYNIIFFPGDVQDFETAMMTGPFAHYCEYSYEAVAELLSKKFGEACNVWIIRPHRFKHGAYSSYDNFVRTNEYGAAIQYDPTASATKHLAFLMQNTQAALRQQGVNVSTVLPMHLLGFSKGGVVLNQLVTELVRYSFNKKRSNNGQIRQGSVYASTRQFFAAVDSIHWLDSGNGSLEGAFPTDKSALAVLARYEQLNLFVHVTPYQYEARQRPWIKNEVNSFINCVKLLGANIQLIIYNAGDECSLASHFHILHDFEADRLFKLKGDGIKASPELAVQPVRIRVCTSATSMKSHKS